MDNQEFLKQRNLLKAALQETDNYLAVEKRALANNLATDTMMHEFFNHYDATKNHLMALGLLQDHIEYMETHVKTMKDLYGDRDNTYKNVYESYELVSIDEEADKGLAAKANKSGISIGTLRKVYKRGVAAWRTGHRPGTTPQQWGMARVNSYIMKGKGTYHGADKDLREAEEPVNFEDDDLESMVKDLDWEDIVDLYTDEELDDGEEEDDEEVKAEEESRLKKLKESLSLQSRIKRKQTFARYKGKRGVARNLKLRRASDMATLQKRAKLAARRALYKRFLRGRDKSQLSAAEKDRIENQVASLKTIQGSLVQKMMPKIRSIEQKRLASYRTKK